MVRCLALPVLGMLGCGRLGFDPLSGDAAGSVPASICKVDRIAIASPPHVADLAIADIPQGYAAIWVDETGDSPARGMVLGPNHQVLGSVELPDLKDTQLGGIFDAGQKLVLSSATGMTETTWTLAHDLTAMSAQATLVAHVMGHNPFPFDVDQLRRAFLTGNGNDLVMAYVASDGLISPTTSKFTVTGPVTDLTCTSATDRGHCVFAEKLIGSAGPSQCTASDIFFDTPTVPQASLSQVLSNDCHDLRTAAGLVPTNSQLVAWATSAGSIEARYVAWTGDIPRTITPAGSAPKVQFDGARFWIAWLDASGELWLSSFDLDGTIVHHALPGWIPGGPEAFELVTRGNETGLVLLSPAGLEFLTICT
jgi:hypothetical protein